jgi:hypothetical protein
MLEVGELEDGRYTWKDATLDDNGELDFGANPLDRRYSWRIKRGSIGQDGADHKVPGAVTARDKIVLRTDNIVVEALLGKSDALDPYASALQALDIKSREADNTSREAETRRISDALDLVKALKDTPDLDLDKAVDAFEKILGEEPDIEVVPVAAVTNDGNP